MGLFRYKALNTASSATTAARQPLLLQPQSPEAALRDLRRLLRQEWSQRHRRTSEVRQLEPTECAAVCLDIVLRHHGLHRPLSELRRACGISRDGSNAAQLVLAARHYGMEARGFKQGIKVLPAVQTPAVLFWEFNHFIVLESLDDTEAWINDPATGRSHLSLEDLDAAYTGIVLTMAPGAAFQPGGHDPARLKTLLRMMRQSTLSPGLLLLLSQIGATGLMLLLLLGVDAASGWIILLAISAAALAPAVHAVARQIEHRRGTQLQRQLLSMPDWALQQHLLRELSGRHQGVRRVTDVLSRELLMSLPVFMLLLLGGVVAAVQAPLTGVLLLLGTACVLALLMLEERLQHPLENEATRRERLQQHQLEHNLQDPRTLKSLSLEQDVLQRWSGLNAQTSEARQHQQHQQRLTDWLPQLLSWALPILLIVLHPGSPTMVIAALIWLWGLDRLRRVQKQWLGLSEPLDRIQAVDAEPIDPLLQTTEVDSPEDTTPRPAAVALRLRNLHYGHVPGRHDLINDLNLTIAAGEWLAIKGRSGSGKTTLLHLMAGLKQPEQGEVLLDHRPLLHWSRRDRCRRIAMVCQDDALLPINIRDNLSLWNPAISDDAILATCAALGLGAVISALPQGLDTELGDGAHNLSGGQRQLLNLARALLEHPQLLLLDEATSALDARSENTVLQHLRTLNCTVVMVAHRSGSLRMADRVIDINQFTTNLTDPTP